MNNYFKISDWLRTIQGSGWYQQEVPSKDIIDKIHEYHWIPINNIRDSIGKPMRVNSGYRSVSYEKSKGRSGSSKHTFKGKGATDIEFWNEETLDNYKKLLKKLNESEYTRIAWYPNSTFFHVDYDSDTKQFFVQGSGGWEYVGYNVQDLIDQMR